MGALDYKTRRHRRNRLAAELAATYSPRRHFRLGQDVGWHWQFDNPNDLYRRRNRLTYTRDFANAAWTKTNGAITPDATTAPDGTLTADLFVESGATGVHRVAWAAGLAGIAGQSLTHFIWLKAAGRQFARLSSNFSDRATDSVSVDLSTGVASVPVGSVVSYSVTDAGNGWWLVSVTQTKTSTASKTFWVDTATGSGAGDNSYTGDGTSGIYIWGAQLEDGAVATEYQDVPTTWAQAYLDAVGADRIYAWTDTAGTTPVTAVGEGIGLLLGREYGGVRGVERVTNGDFSGGTTGWTVAAFGAHAITISGGAVRFQTTGAADSATMTQALTLPINKCYDLEFDVLAGSSGQLKVLPFGGSSGEIIFSCTPGRKRFMGPVTISNTLVFSRVAGQTADAYLTNITIREIPGTHLTQATGTARPTLSARVNLLTYTEQFDNAAWVKTTGDPATSQGTGLAAVVTANYGTAPNGTLTADRLQLSLAGGANAAAAVNRSGTAQTILAVTAGANYKSVLHLKALDGTDIAAAISAGLGVVLAAGGPAAVYTVTSLADGWVQVASTATPSFSSGTWRIQLYSLPGSTLNTLDLLVWGADLRTADDAAKNIPAYQRVGATASDHDTDGFPHGVYPDGTDDSGTTATGGGNTTGFFYCGALTVSGGAGAARTIWSDTGTNTGYRVRINASNKLELAAGNGSAYTTVQSNETITAPGTYLLSAWDDGGVLAVQVNNLAPATTTRPTVSAGTAAITAYKDNGAASSYFNGRDYGSVYRQQYPGETAHNRIKRYLANVARITA